METSSSQIDQLMRSLGEDVNISNPPDDGRQASSSKSSSLTVSPPPRDNAAFFSMTQTTHQMAQQGFLTSPPGFDMASILSFMPSPTAFWINALPVSDPIPPQPSQSIDPNPTSSNVTPSVESTPFEQLQSHSESDLLDSSPEYPWFPQDSAMSSYTDPLLALLNLSPVATKPGDRSLPIVPEGSGRSPRRVRSPSPSRFNDVSPLASPLTSTPNSPFSSEGGFCSDGGDDSMVGGALSASSSKPKRKTPDRALDESEEIQSPGDGPSPKKQ